VSGLLEGLVEPGEQVEQGQPIARIWSPDGPTRTAVEVPAARTGLLLGLRAVPVVAQGKGIAFVGEPIARDALLAEGAGSEAAVTTVLAER
jgi:predicted deacylase